MVVKRWVSSVGLDWRDTVKAAKCVACVQRVGKIWVIVVRETAWSQFRAGVPSGWMYYIMM